MPRQVLSNEAERAPAGGVRNSTSQRRAPRSLLDLLSGLAKADLDAFLAALSPNALMSLPWLFEHWALGHQLPPEGDWTTWVILGGRGAGKTRAGAEWIRAQVEGGKPGDPGSSSRVALVGETLDEAREVMVFGASGILACSPPDRRPEWQATRKRLVWPNGAVAQIFSASDPESLRGPQFDAAWCDELGKWKKGEAAWDMLQFALRLGDRPRAVVTTTPRSEPLLTALLAAAGTVVTRAPTAANRMHLAEGFVEAVTAKYAGTRLGRQELDGEFVLDADGRALDLGDAAGGAGAAAARARPGGGGGRPAGDQRRGRRRMRHRRRRGEPGRAAAGLDRRGDRRRQRRGARRRAAGPSGRWSSSTPTAPTGWWRR